MLKYKQHEENEIIVDQVKEGFPIAFIQQLVSNVTLYLMENPQEGTKGIFCSVNYLWYVVCELAKGSTQKEIGLNVIREYIEDLSREYWNMGGVFMDNEQFEFIHKTITQEEADQEEAGEPEPENFFNEDPGQGSLPDIVDKMFTQRIDQALELIELGGDDTLLKNLKEEIRTLSNNLAEQFGYIDALLKVRNVPEKL